MNALRKALGHHRPALLLVRQFVALPAALFVVLALPLALHAQTPTSVSRDHIMKLTPTDNTAEREGSIVAPGGGNQDYNVFSIDTRAFPDGVVLVIDIQI